MDGRLKNLVTPLDFTTLMMMMVPHPMILASTLTQARMMTMIQPHLSHAVEKVIVLRTMMTVVIPLLVKSILRR